MCGSCRNSVRGVVGTMNAARSRPDWLAKNQSGRKQAQSRVRTPGFMRTQWCKVWHLDAIIKAVIRVWKGVVDYTPSIHTCPIKRPPLCKKWLTKLDWNSSVCPDTF